MKRKKERKTNTKLKVDGKRERILIVWIWKPCNMSFESDVVPED